MPLPKSSSIAARATEVYAETWDAILQKYCDIPPQREEEVAELHRLLAYLRQLLTCCACAGLLQDAMISLSCGHCYCHDCQFRTPILKIQCRQCRERTGLVIENQLRIVVQCYRRMCLILADCLSQLPKPPVTCEKLPTGGDQGLLKEGVEEGTKPKEPAEFDPIPEILKEVQEGVKVTRAVLIVRPPAKYLKPPTSSTVKKDTSKVSPLVSKSTTSTSKSSSSAVTEERDRAESENPSEVETSPKAQPTKHKRLHRKKTGPLTKWSQQETPTMSKARDTPKIRHRKRKALVKLEDAGMNSEEEIDVVSYPGSVSSRTRFNMVTVRQDDLEIGTNCLDAEYVDTTTDEVTVSEDNPTLICKEPPPLSSLPNRKISVFGSKGSTPHHFLSRPVKSKPGQSRGRKTQLSEAEENPVKPVSSKHIRKVHLISDTSTQSSDDESAVEVRDISPETDGSPSPLISVTASGAPITATPPKKRRKRNHGDRPRCRCGTNNPQAIERICARNKCPCFHQRIPCVNCLCRMCHNPNTVITT